MRVIIDYIRYTVIGRIVACLIGAFICLILANLDERVALGAIVFILYPAWIILVGMFYAIGNTYIDIRAWFRRW